MVRPRTVAFVGPLGLAMVGCFGVYTPLPSDGSSSSAAMIQSTGPVTTGTTGDATTDATTSNSDSNSNSNSNGPGTSSTANTDTTSSTASETGIEDCSCKNEIDALIVFDKALIAAAPELANAVLQLFKILPTIFDDFCGFHFGITTSAGAPGNPEGCQGIGALAQGIGGFGCEEFAGRSYLDEVPQPQDLIQCFGPAFIENSPLEHRPVGSALEALSASMNAPGGCNEGFFRPEVPLYVVFFSARDETMQPGNAGAWNLQLRNINQDSKRVASPLGFGLFAGAEEPSEGTTTGGEEPMCPLPAPENLVDLANTVVGENRFVADVCSNVDDLRAAYVEAFDVAKVVCE